MAPIFWVIVHGGEARTACPEQFGVVVSWRYDSAALATITRGARAAHGPGDAVEASGGARAAASRSGPLEGNGRRVGTPVGAHLAERFAAPVVRSPPSPQPTGAP
jgi:hypothetical protein